MDSDPGPAQAKEWREQKRIKEKKFLFGLEILLGLGILTFTFKFSVN